MNQDARIARTIGCLSLGVLLGYAAHGWEDSRSEPEPIEEAYFGFRDLDLAAYPACQTDLTMSEAWTTRLIYLNGVWTAGCVEETARRREEAQQEETSQ